MGFDHEVRVQEPYLIEVEHEPAAHHCLLIADVTRADPDRTGRARHTEAVLFSRTGEWRQRGVEPEITEQAKPFNGKRQLAKRTAQLQQGSIPFFIGYTPGMTTGYDSFFLATYSFALFSYSKIVRQFPYDFVAGYDETEDGTIILHLKDGSDLPIKKLPMVESFALKASLETFPAMGPNTKAWMAWQARRTELANTYVPTQNELAKATRAAEVTTREQQAQAEKEHQRALKERAATKTWSNTRLPTGPPNKAGGLTILQHCHEGEEPWFILTSMGAGCMACFDDRLMVIKAGNMQGFMAGTMFGSRSTTFYYHDINAIEFNKQLFGSVLEVLSASYQGTANHDYWRGTTRGRNSDSGDPWTLSNTLPIGNDEYARARGELSELRRRIAEVKRPTMNAAVPTALPAAPAPRDDFVAQMTKLVELHDVGVLTDEEFAAAKARLLSGPSA